MNGRNTEAAALAPRPAISVRRRSCSTPSASPTWTGCRAAIQRRGTSGALLPRATPVCPKAPWRSSQTGGSGFRKPGFAWAKTFGPGRARSRTEAWLTRCRFLSGAASNLALDHGRRRMLTIEVTPYDPEVARVGQTGKVEQIRSEEHTSELQALMRIQYAVLCLHTKNKTNHERHPVHTIAAEQYYINNE